MRPPAHTSSASARHREAEGLERPTSRERARRVAAELAADLPGLFGTRPGTNPLVCLPEGYEPVHPERPTFGDVPAPVTRGDCLTSVQRWAVDARYGDGTPKKPPRYLTIVREDGRRVKRPADAQPDGVNARRPCPYVGCRHHLAHFYDGATGQYHLTGAHSVDGLLDALERGARILDAGRGWAYLRGDLTPEERADPTYGPGAMVFSCALDVVMALDDPTLELVGRTFERTRERVRQLEAQAIETLRLVLEGTPLWYEFYRAWQDSLTREHAAHHLTEAESFSTF